MNILLDGFYDLNYGDDLFIETITGLFPKCKFYSFLEYYPPRVIEKAGKIANLYLLPECGAFLKKNMFDAYICVGGDVFPDHGDYTKRKAYVNAVKAVGGVVAFWGFNLFHDYCEETRKDLVELMENADIVAPRDEKSAAYLRDLMPGKEISAIADLAFLSQWKQAAAADVLGISVRRPNYATEEDMARYSAKLQEVIGSYLAGKDSRRVKIFSLSTGSTSDEAVTQQIIDGVVEKDRVEHVLYTGDTDFIKAEIAKCDVMICTRLHAMISCVAQNVPFIPVVYEVKMDHILEEIGYQGEVVRFLDIGDAKLDLDQAKANVLWDKQAEKAYMAHTEAVMAKLRNLLGYDSLRATVAKADLSGPSCEERENLVKIYQGALDQRNIDVATLEKALAEMAAELQAIKSTFEYRAAQKVKRILHR